MKRLAVPNPMMATCPICEADPEWGKTEHLPSPECPSCHGIGSVDAPWIAEIRNGFEDAAHGMALKPRKPGHYRCDYEHDQGITVPVPSPPPRSCNCWKSTFAPLLDGLIARASASEKALAETQDKADELPDVDRILDEALAGNGFTYHGTAARAMAVVLALAEERIKRGKYLLRLAKSSWPGHYISTYCMHGDHDQCRMNSKYGEPCMCADCTHAGLVAKPSYQDLEIQLDVARKAIRGGQDGG